MGDERQNCHATIINWKYGSHKGWISTVLVFFKGYKLYAFRTKKCNVIQLEKEWRSTTKVSIRYDDNNAKIVFLAVTKFYLQQSKYKIFVFVVGKRTDTL